MSTNAPIIVLIEDESSVRLPLKLVLEAMGFQVFDFTEAKLGLQHIRNDMPVDAVICDLRMPQMSGLSVLEESKRLAPELPFILMSAHVQGPEIEKAKQKGADAIISKPFSQEELKAVLSTLKVGLSS